MQTSLHIWALVRALQTEGCGGDISSTAFYRKERAAYIFIKRDKKRWALGFRYHPAGAGVFLVPASKIRPDTREKPRPLFGFDNGTIVAAEQLGFDRIFSLVVDRSGVVSHLVFEALGPNGNLWHLDDSRARLSSLRKSSFTPGETYEPPPLPGRLDPREITIESLRANMPTEECSVRLFLERNLLGFNRTLAREAAYRADCADVTTESCDSEAAQRLVAAINEITERFAQPVGGFLYDFGRAVEVYPFRLSSVDETPERFKTLSLATLAMCDLKRSVRDEADDEKRTLNAVHRQIKKLERRLASVAADLAQAADFERFKKLGELLQINFGRLKNGMTEITVEDVYLETPQPVTIPLDSALTPKQNVEVYFKKYRKGRDGVDLLTRRREVTGEELAEMKTIASSLEADFEAARLRYAQELAPLLPKTGTSGSRPTTVERLPYREYRLSTGLKLLVGRDGADNDRTTFDHARPYELWFHAQQCPGSHVVLKLPNKSFQPSRAEIEEAASVAAYHSKARRDSLVAVIYTERRYVRKPRKAKPGLVTVEREKSLMVAPRPPVNDPHRSES